MNLILRSMRAKTVIGSSHQGFTRNKLCLISFPLAEEERAQHVLCPVFAKTFTPSHTVSFQPNWREMGWMGRLRRWVGNWLDHQSGRMICYGVRLAAVAVALLVGDRVSSSLGLMAHDSSWEPQLTARAIS